MADSTYVFESGEAIEIGGHGQTDFLYHSGDAVLNQGLSTYVFESGTGLGADLLYEVNNNGLNDLEAISTAETHKDFYGYDDNGNKGATHGYDEYQVVTVFLHENTNNKTFGIILTVGDNGNNEPDTSVKVNYSVTINSADYLEKDGESNDEFTTDYAGLGYNGPSTDGFALDADSIGDITFTLDNSYNHSGQGNTSGPDDFRLITKDGTTPDGGATIYAGMSGSIRFVVG